ncbi:MAG: hypothetical protein AB1597_09395 [Chloroflexota bacterium]
MAVLATACPAPSTPSPTPPSPTPPGGSIGIGVDPSKEPGREDVNYITPSMVEIGNVYPGDFADFELTVHNGGKKPTTFTVTVRSADKTKAGYEKLPGEYLNWIRIDDTNPSVGSMESKKVLVTVTMPASVTAPGKRYEAWVVVKDMGQEGNVQIELACRVLIETGA